MLNIIPILRDFYGKYQNTFQNIAFSVLLKANPKPMYSSKHSKTGEPHFSKHIENDNVFECLRADMNLKSFVIKQATEQTCLVQPQNRMAVGFSLS